MKSPFWIKNVGNFNFGAVNEIYIGDFSNISTYRQKPTKQKELTHLNA